MPQLTTRRTPVTRLVAALIGALFGFGLTVLLYFWLNPILEARTDWTRELQGFLFTTVPVGTVVGAAIGWALGGRSPRNQA
jgi:apolipoprotein N-acyltransferase